MTTAGRDSVRCVPATPAFDPGPPSRRNVRGASRVKGWIGSGRDAGITLLLHDTTRSTTDRAEAARHAPAGGPGRRRE